jgi:hypothetical protein
VRTNIIDVYRRGTSPLSTALETRSTAFTTPDAVRFEVFDLDHGRRPHAVKLVADLDP